MTTEECVLHLERRAADYSRAALSLAACLDANTHLIVWASIHELPCFQELSDREKGGMQIALGSLAAGGRNSQPIDIGLALMGCVIHRVLNAFAYEEPERIAKQKADREIAVFRSIATREKRDPADLGRVGMTCVSVCERMRAAYEHK